MRLPVWLVSASCLFVPISAFYPHRPDNVARGKRESPAFHSRIHPRDVPTSTASRNKQRVRRENLHSVSLADPDPQPNSMVISQDGDDLSYFSSIQVGSEGKTMWMLIDSGSANTWLFGAACTTDACSGHETLASADSKTLEIRSDTWDISYGSGNVSGVQARDSFAFAGYHIQLDFGLATEASDYFSAFPVDGILGLGRDLNGDMGGPSVMQAILEAGLVEANMFSVRLSSSEGGETNGHIIFGPPDESQFSGSLSYTDTVDDEGLWKIPLEAVAVDGEKLQLEGTREAIIDTGSSWILLPRNDAVAVHDQIPGSSSAGEEDFVVPCDTEQMLQFTFSGQSYDMPPTSYVGDREDDGDKCVSKIVAHQAFDNDEVILGAAFMKHVYTVFDFDEHRIGFAALTGA